MLIALYDGKLTILQIHNNGGFNMNKRKYPFSMFFMGTILNLIRLWSGFIIVIILFIICTVNPIVPIAIPIALTGLLVLIAIIQQYRNRKIMLSHFNNDETNELLDKMFADNSKGYKNITDAVDEIIKNHESDIKQ